MALLPHEYISDACHHEFHEYCKGTVPIDGKLVKTPGYCRYCNSGCHCDCHRQGIKNETKSN